MTSPSSPFAAEAAARQPRGHRLWGARTLWEAQLERIGERLNPILVKEARQALKSKQFLITFTLVLTCGWFWSLVGVALLSPGIYYAPGGRFMLGGYFLILAAPVLLVVPFSAFRSLAAEREDGTFELLSITALTSRQIVTGKLGSSILQMLVYYSALSPCLAFTYLLRGVDIFTIVLILLSTLWGSILLSALALMIAAAARARHWQVVVSVLLLIGLLIATVSWCGFMVAMISNSDGAMYEDPAFWQSALAIACFHASFVTLFVIAAAGQLSFASDNRSTSLRVVLLAQQFLWLGWMTYAWLASQGEEVLYVSLTIGGLYWYVMGALLTGERAELSPRVKRSLPQSFLGRAFLTWFNPGSGTGYAFATLNLLAFAAVSTALAWGASLLGFRGAPDRVDWYLFTWVLLAYVVAYLGAGRLLVLSLRRVLRMGLVLVLLMHLGLVAMGAAVPAFTQAWMQGYRNLDYSLWQAPNWIWTLYRAADGDLVSHPGVPILIVAAALVLFGLNLFMAIREVAQVRESTPQRVLEDEASLPPSPHRVSEVRM